MKEKLDLNSWIRKDHFEFFNTFDEPFFGVTVSVDCTATYLEAKEKDVSFFLLYLHKSLLAANSIEPFRYRIIDGEVWKYEQVHASATINRPNGTFGFGYIDFHPDFESFKAGAMKEINKVENSTGLIPSAGGENVIHCSALPWLNFKSISHARNFSFKDSCPKLSFGQVREEGGRKLMSVSIHVNHALMDGFHVSQFVSVYQDLLNQKTSDLIAT
ncbi:chloramphenicol acetyltransferase [Pedobacter sp. CFBP9032]|uniref:chloramphenicol acetyltransferase n=1 Tax=Pedobacter sp. CFBP9032 TaxID=3096539 RepID=UPI002A6A26A1|nr:chloramphenicol acetyltransferase [Pedobacter sp. CFBP9032]MDY0903335.1 chloramphenicol acetyltransferase [Pedobacter sp. CFBP9032]